MPFVDTGGLEPDERRPGWFGRYFDSETMSFAHFHFTKGSWIHEHYHPQEEVWQVVEGELEITIDGETRTAGPGFAGIVPPNAPHSVTALSDGKAIVVDYPVRSE